LSLAIRRRRSSLGDLKVACCGVADLREAFCEISERRRRRRRRKDFPTPPPANPCRCCVAFR
jgi:hypothetical protein